MRLKMMWIGAIALAALTLVVSPVFAAHGGGGHGGGGRSGGGGGAHAAVRGGGGARMATGAPRVGAVSRGVAVPRGGVAGAYGYRGYGYGGYRGFGFGRPYYAFSPRLSLGFGLWAGYPVAYPYYYGYPYAYGAYGYPYADPYSYSYPSYSYPSYGGYAPSAGYAQPNGYPSANGYPAPAYGYQSQAPSGYPSSGYPPQAGNVGVQPGAESSGGVSFQISPSTAAVFVDGSAVGTVGTFGPTSQPLTLTPGRHHIEVQAPGYQTMAFDTEVMAGQVIPYQGTMQAAGNR
jgi:hypothetical protein